MADRLLDLLKKRETSSGTAKLQTPKYMDAMVLSKGTVADINQIRTVDTISTLTLQVFNVSVDGTTVNPRTAWTGVPDRYTLIDYLQDDYFDPQF
jgi:hypothetical protein